MRSRLLLVVLCMFLFGGCSWSLTQVRVRTGLEYGENDATQSASWTERTYNNDGTHWKAITGVEFMFKPYTSRAKRHTKEKNYWNQRPNVSEVW